MKAEKQVARKRLIGTSEDRKDSKKKKNKGRATTQTERKQEVQYDREVMPCSRI